MTICENSVILSMHVVVMPRKVTSAATARRKKKAYQAQRRQVNEVFDTSV